MIENRLKRFLFKKILKLAFIYTIQFYIAKTLFFYYVFYINDLENLQIAASIAHNTYYYIIVFFVYLGLFISDVAYMTLRIKLKKVSKNYLTVFSLLPILSLGVFGFYLSMYMKNTYSLAAYTSEIKPCVVKEDKIECKNGYIFIFTKDIKIDKRVSLNNTLFIQ